MSAVIESLNNVVTARDRGWLIVLAIWSAVLWPVFQHFDRSGQRLDANQGIPNQSHVDNQIAVSNYEDGNAGNGNKAKAIHGGNEIRFQFTDEMTADEPRFIDAGPDPDVLMRSRLDGAFVRHGKDWVWEQRLSRSADAVGGSWMVGGDKAVWIDDPEPLAAE